jgi:hypothetical protein
LLKFDKCKRSNLQLTDFTPQEMKYCFPLTLMVLILLSVTSIANAQEEPSESTQKTAPWFVERFRITVGGFVPVSNTNIQVGLKGNVAGTEIDFEKDLGFDQSQFTFLSNLQWRISKRSRLNLYYYNIPRSSSHTINKEISFKGETYAINTLINSYFNTAIYQVSYGYAILSKPKYELGLMLGTHLVGGEIGLSAVGTNINASASERFGFTAPLPDLGIWGGYAFNKRFAINLDANYLSVSIDEYSGRIFAYNLLFIYRMLDRLDLSLGMSGLNCNLGIARDKADATIKWSYNGPSLGLTYSFGKNNWQH